MPAERLGGPLGEHADRLDRQGRQRIGPAPRRIEGIGAGQATDAHLPFDPGVVGLEVGVGDRPVVEAGSGDRPLEAPLDEVHLVETPVVAGEVDGAAAHHAAVLQRRHQLGGLRLGGAEGVRLFREVVGERRQPAHRQLIVAEVLGPEIGPLLQHHHRVSGARRAPGRLCRPRHPSLRPRSPRPRWAGNGRGGSPVVVPEGRLPHEAILEADQLPADLVLVAAVFRIGEQPLDGGDPDGLEEHRLRVVE